MSAKLNTSPSVWYVHGLCDSHVVFLITDMFYFPIALQLILCNTDTLISQKCSVVTAHDETNFRPV